MDERLANIHPGEVLEEEFWEPFHISESQLAKAIRLPRARVEGILYKKRCVTPNFELWLVKVFGTSAQFWLGLQMDYELVPIRITFSATVHNRILRLFR